SCGRDPGRDTDDRVGPSRTGRRPACSTERTACSSSAVDAADGPGSTSAAGCPHSPRMTGANVAAVNASVTRTLADGPMAAQSAEAAAIEPRYVADAPTPRSCTRLISVDDSDELAGLDRPGFSVVTSGGSASASTQQAPTAARAAREAPTAEARDSSHEDIHTPNR